MTPAPACQTLNLGICLNPSIGWSATTSKVHGNGLGLVITRELVQAMGGRLECGRKGARQPLSGAFAFGRRVPCVHHSRQRGTGAVSMGYRRARLRAVHRDDEVNALPDAADLRHPAGWELIVETTGARGADVAFIACQPSFLLDMNLPDMRGDEIPQGAEGSPGDERHPITLLSARGCDAEHYSTRSGSRRA